LNADGQHKKSYSFEHLGFRKQQFLYTRSTSLVMERWNAETALLQMWNMISKFYILVHFCKCVICYLIFRFSRSKKHQNWKSCFGCVCEREKYICFIVCVLLVCFDMWRFSSILFFKRDCVKRVTNINFCMWQKMNLET